jgi:hypothetical protein
MTMKRTELKMLFTVVLAARHGDVRGERRRDAETKSKTCLLVLPHPK